jgi:hypothetical protein
MTAANSSNQKISNPTISNARVKDALALHKKGGAIITANYINLKRQEENTKREEEKKKYAERYLLTKRVINLTRMASALMWDPSTSKNGNYDSQHKQARESYKEKDEDMSVEMKHRVPLYVRAARIHRFLNISDADRYWLSHDDFDSSSKTRKKSHDNACLHRMVNIRTNGMVVPYYIKVKQPNDTTLSIKAQTYFTFTAYEVASDPAGINIKDSYIKASSHDKVFESIKTTLDVHPFCICPVQIDPDAYRSYFKKQWPNQKDNIIDNFIKNDPMSSFLLVFIKGRVEGVTVITAYSLVNNYSSFSYHCVNKVMDDLTGYVNYALQKAYQNEQIRLMIQLFQRRADYDTGYGIMKGTCMYRGVLNEDDQGSQFLRSVPLTSMLGVDKIEDLDQQGPLMDWDLTCNFLMAEALCFAWTKNMPQKKKRIGQFCYMTGVTLVELGYFFSHKGIFVKTLYDYRFSRLFEYAVLVMYENDPILVNKDIVPYLKDYVDAALASHVSPEASKKAISYEAIMEWIKNQEFLKLKSKKN